MSAKEMFEKLGYKISYFFGDIEYIKQFKYANITIYFDTKDKTIEFVSDKDIVINIDFEELQAINKQVEELGWK